jgi:hypothetical protein
MVGMLDRCKATPAKPKYIVELELHAIYDGNQEINSRFLENHQMFDKIIVTLKDC